MTVIAFMCLHTQKQVSGWQRLEGPSLSVEPGHTSSSLQTDVINSANIYSVTIAHPADTEVNKSACPH